MLVFNILCYLLIGAFISVAVQIVIMLDSTHFNPKFFTTKDYLWIAVLWPIFLILCVVGILIILFEKWED